MKKFYFILVVSLISFQSEIHAQTFSGGVTFGINATQVAGDGLGGFDKLGLNGGGFVSYEFSERTSGTMELLYTQKGSQKKPNHEAGDYESFILRLHYIEVPLMVNFRFNDFVLDVGGSVGALVKSTSEYNSYEYPNNPPYEDFEIAGLIGFKYMITENFFGSFRASHSIIPVRPTPDDSQVWSFYDAGQFNQVLMFNLGWKF